MLYSAQTKLTHSRLVVVLGVLVTGEGGAGDSAAGGLHGLGRARAEAKYV